MSMATMSEAPDITIRRLSDALGAEVIGVDLSQPLEPSVVALLQQAFLEHHLLAFRDQNFTEQQQISFSELFGPLEVFPEQDKTKGSSQTYHVANTSQDGKHLGANATMSIYQKVNQRWHTDSSYRFIPSLASLMFAIEVLPDEAEGGETEFSNMFLAYDALPNELKEDLEHRHMAHYYEFGRRLFPELPPVSAAEREAVPPVCHPVVRIHPERGGRRSLYFTTNAGNEIGGFTAEDGAAMHRRLSEHASNQRFTYKHRWKDGDFVMWDNRCLLHRAIPYDMDKYRRALRRTTVAGAGPIVGPFSPEARQYR